MNPLFGRMTEMGLRYLHDKDNQPPVSQGGETQQLKIARELANAPLQSRKGPPSNGILYVVDERTRERHLEDMKRLLAVLGQLVEESNTVLVAEHYLDVIKCADWVIDLRTVILEQEAGKPAARCSHKETHKKSPTIQSPSPDNI